MSKSGNREIQKSGNREIQKYWNREIQKSGNPEIWESGNQDIWDPISPKKKILKIRICPAQIVGNVLISRGKNTS